MNAQLAQDVAVTTFIKLGQDGGELPADATGHLAVLDTAAGLYHAVGVCPKRLSLAQAKKLADKLNAEKYAGIDTWKVPTVKQAFSITDHTRYAPAADIAFFPDMQSDYYWTCEDHSYFTSCVFAVYFSYGGVGYLYRSLEAFCRPVASVAARQ